MLLRYRNAAQNLLTAPGPGPQGVDPPNGETLPQPPRGKRGKVPKTRAADTGNDRGT